MNSKLENIPDPGSIPLPDLDPDTIPLPEPEPLQNQVQDPQSIPLPEEEPSNVIEDKDAQKEKEIMARMMGFSNFDTTKGKKVPGNQIGAVRVVKKRRYRQYMNRKGGFNRPLDKVA